MRAELLGQLVGAQFAIERAITELAGSALAEGEQQLQLLKGLQRQIGSADLTTLKSLRAEITATVAVAHAAVQQGRATATAETVAILAEAATSSREQVKVAMENMHRFDAFLQFSPGDSEADYRQREAERRAYIDAQHAKGTPQGDLNASGDAVGQMVDAKAHGAGDSPEFQQRWTELVATTEKLRNAARANGVSTEEFDRHLRADLRRIMKSKGISDAEIDARFASQPDPLEAAKAFVNETDVTAINGIAARAGTRDLENTASATSMSPSSIKSLAVDPMAEFRAAGVTIAAIEPSGHLSHGVPNQSPTPANSRRATSV